MWRLRLSSGFPGEVDKGLFSFLFEPDTWTVCFLELENNPQELSEPV